MVHNIVKTERERSGSMILLDYRDKRPIYEQVVDKLEHLIVGGAGSFSEFLPESR